MSVGLGQRQRYALVLDFLHGTVRRRCFCGANSDGLAKRNGNTISCIAWPGSSTHSTDESFSAEPMRTHFSQSFATGITTVKSLRKRFVLSR